MNSVELINNSLEWLKDNYSCYRFYKERDIIFMLQTYLNDFIKKNSLPFKSYNDYPILCCANKRHLADLVIKTNDEKDDMVDAAVEFKYEPDKKRKNTDMLSGKFPAVCWNGEYSVLGDIERIRKYIQRSKANHAYSIFIDEGRHFYKNPRYDKKTPKDSKWVE